MRWMKGRHFGRLLRRFWSVGSGSSLNQANPEEVNLIAAPEILDTEMGFIPSEADRFASPHFSDVLEIFPDCNAPTDLVQRHVDLIIFLSGPTDRVVLFDQFEREGVLGCGS